MTALGGLLDGRVDTLVTALFWAALFFYVPRGWWWLKQQKENYQRDQQLVKARKRVDLFAVKADFGRKEVEANSRQRNPTKRIEALTRRYEYFKAAITDAELVINDDMLQFNAFRQQLQKLVPPYDNLMSILRDDIVRLPNIQNSSGLKMTDRFKIPAELTPAALRKRFNHLSYSSTTMYRSFHQLNPQATASSTGFVILFTFFIGIFRYYRELSRLRIEAEKMQGEVDLYAIEVQGALEVLQELQRFVKDLQHAHEKQRQKLDELLKRVLTITTTAPQQGRSVSNFFSLTPEEQSVFESLYVEGEHLKCLLSIPIISSTTNAGV